MTKLRQIFCILSTAAGLALIFLWGRSTLMADHAFFRTWRYDNLGATEKCTRYGLLSHDGSIGLWYWRSSGPTPPSRRNAPLPSSEWAWRVNGGDDPMLPSTGRLHLRIGEVDELTHSGGLSYVSYVFLVPYALLIVLAGIVPLRSIWLLCRNLHRARHGLCARCGYDLRGSSGRCPECGMDAQRR